MTEETTDTAQPQVETPLKTNEEICEAVRTILKNNDVNRGTKRARTIEASFLQGLMYANIKYYNAYLGMCLHSGRSILD
jgi:hypothetical protein